MDYLIPHIDCILMHLIDCIIHRMQNTKNKFQRISPALGLGIAVFNITRSLDSGAYIYTIIHIAQEIETLTILIQTQEFIDCESVWKRR